MQLTCPRQFSASLGTLQLGSHLIELFFEFPLLIENRFFFLPFRFQRGRFLLQLAQFFLELFQTFLAGGIFLFFQRLPLHLVLHDLTLNHVNLRRHRIELDLQSRGRFIDQIDRLVRQIAIADIAM